MRSIVASRPSIIPSALISPNKSLAAIALPKGRADVIIETDDDIFIFEFKLDGSAEEALKQIDEKQYALPYLNDPRKLHKIGVNISSESRTVEKWLVSE